MENTIPENESEITLAAFQRWVQSSRPGQSFVYHIGHLMVEREKIAQIPGVGIARVFIEPYNGIGEYAWWAYERGLVELVQRKRPDGRFEYIAQKRRKRRK